MTLKCPYSKYNIKIWLHDSELSITSLFVALCDHFTQNKWGNIWKPSKAFSNYWHISVRLSSTLMLIYDTNYCLFIPRRIKAAYRIFLLINWRIKMSKSRHQFETTGCHIILVMVSFEVCLNKNSTVRSFSIARLFHWRLVWWHIWSTTSYLYFIHNIIFKLVCAQKY